MKNIWRTYHGFTWRTVDWLLSRRNPSQSLWIPKNTTNNEIHKLNRSLIVERHTLLSDLSQGLMLDTQRWEVKNITFIMGQLTVNLLLPLFDQTVSPSRVFTPQTQPAPLSPTCRVHVYIIHWWLKDIPSCCFKAGIIIVIVLFWFIDTFIQCCMNEYHSYLVLWESNRCVLTAAGLQQGV